MTYSIQSGKQDPVLDYVVTDAATGAPMQVTVLGGAVALVPEQRGVRAFIPGQAQVPEPIGFYVPGVAALAPGPDPVIVAEASLAQVGIWAATNMVRMYGVGEVEVTLVPDQQQPGHRWLWLNLGCIGGDPMVVRYRITLYRPR
jgi:hypothetical protein